MGKGRNSAFGATNDFRNDGWQGLEDALVISADHSGNPVYLKSNGEVWINDHDFGGPSEYASSFEAYLMEVCLDDDWGDD